MSSQTALDTESASRESDASEAAELLLQLVRDKRSFPEEAVRDLRRLLSHDLARRDSAALRLGHLRLLIEMLLALDPSDEDAWVSQADYMAERARRAANGETYPSEGALRNAYGCWVSAVRAASRFVKHGGAARVPADHSHTRPGMSYKPEEVMGGLIRCRRDLGDWPSEWEYYEWARIKRRLTNKDPRVPSATPLRKFGGFSNALRMTRAAFKGNPDLGCPGRGQG